MTGDPWAELRAALDEPTPDMLAACARLGGLLAAGAGEQR